MGLKDLVNVVVELPVWLPVTEHVQELVLLRDPEPEMLPVCVSFTEIKSDLERLPVAVVDTEPEFDSEDVRVALVMLPLILAVRLLLRLSLGVKLKLAVPETLPVADSEPVLELDLLQVPLFVTVELKLGLRDFETEDVIEIVCEKLCDLLKVAELVPEAVAVADAV